MRCLEVSPAKRPSAEEVCRALEAIACGAAGTGRARSTRPTANPYLGLSAFGAEHRAVFFGRAAETWAVLDALRASPVTLVAGASGAGKSSVVRAGVLPRVRAGALGAGAWCVVELVPGARPIERLAQALARAIGSPGEEVAATLAASPEAIRSLVATSGPRDGACTVLFVDQLEEAWTLADAAGREGLFQAMAALADLGPSARVIATLRGDFLDRLGDLPGRRATVLIGPLSDEGLRQAILGPAKALGVTVDASLAEPLIEAAREVGSLPLLEFALAAMWERRDPAASTLGPSEPRRDRGSRGPSAPTADAALARA